jgi:hypothetical protein
MKVKTILLSFYFLIFVTSLLHAQSNKQPASAVTLQDIYNRIDGLEQKFDQKFEAMDKRLIEIEKTLAVYDERFQAINKIFMIFGSIFGVVILIAVSVFGYYFNKLGQLIREIERLDARVDAKRNQFIDKLITDDLVKKFHSFLRQEVAEPARVSDEKAEYKAKSE